jgi:hypothetical protein
MTFQVAMVLLIAIAVFFFVMKQKQEGSSNGQHLYKSKPLLSANEKEFFNRLSQALPDCHILTQVAFGALLQPVRNNNKGYYRTRGTFSQKIADYVICNKEMYVLAVVELDDRTHRNDKDAKRDAMLVQAGYKVIRWDSKNKPTAEQIRERF